MNMKSYCTKHKVDFEERRTILWHVYEEEANEIIEANSSEGHKLELPFFYGTTSGEVISGNSFTSTDEIINLIKKEKRSD